MLDAIESALLVLLVVLLAFIWLVPIAGKWKVYGKLGMPGWYSIVPVFADYKLCERVHRDDGTRTFLMAYLIVLICSWVFCWVDTLSWMLALVQLVMTIIVLNDLSHASGRRPAIRSGWSSLASCSGRCLGSGQASRSIWMAMRTMSPRG